MKKTFIFALLTAVFVAMTSCNESKLQKVVESTNKECPISMGMFGEMTSIVFDGDNVVMSATVNEDLVGIDELCNADQNVMSKNLIISFMNSHNESGRELLRALDAEKVGLVIRYVGGTMGKVYSITLSPEDIASVDMDSEPDPKEALEAQVAMTNAQYPDEVGEGLVMTKVAVEDGYFVYYCMVDEDVCSIDELEEVKSEIKTCVKMGLSDLAMRNIAKQCKAANIGIACKYIGRTSNRECVIEIPPSEF